MTLLALETVTRAGSLALAIDGRVVARAGDPSRTHGARLPGELIAFLAEHGLTIGDLDLTAVVIGPGSFTGLRVGLASMQGLAIGRQLRVVGIPTLEAVAASWTFATGALGRVIACIDGQRGEVFLAGFDVPPAGFHGARVIVRPMVGTPDEAAQAVREATSRAPLVVVGDAAAKYASAFARWLPDARLVDVPMPMAEAAAKLAIDRVHAAGPPHALRPIYLRRPDAEIARERARAAVRPATDAGHGETIRRASGSDDLSAVEALQRRTFTNPWGAEAIRWELENTDVARLYATHDAAGVLIAYCACWMVFDELHINSLAVDPARRRHGVAKRLLRQVFRDAVASGAASATLEVRHSNAAAIALYEGLGFRGEGVRRDYYQDPREDALILWNRRLRDTS